MKILVCVKQVPDTTDVAVDENHSLLRAGVAQILNPADEAAVAFALEMKAAHAAHVTILTMGRPEAEGMLRDLLSRGADGALLLTDTAFAGADTLATARTLRAAADKAGPFDLLLLGRRAADGETGQVGPMLASLLNMPIVTDATDLGLEDGELRVTQLHERGSAVWAASPPAAVTCCAWSRPLPLPTIAGLRRARTAEILRWGRDDLMLDGDLCGLRGSPTRVVRAHAASQGARNCVFLTAEALLAKGVLS